MPLWSVTAIRTVPVADSGVAAADGWRSRSGWSAAAAKSPGSIRAFTLAVNCWRELVELRLRGRQGLVAQGDQRADVTGGDLRGDVDPVDRDAR